TQHLSTRLKHLAAVEARLRLGLVHPVYTRFLEQLAVAERHVDPDIGVLRSRFEQPHRMLAVRAQPIGQHASGRAGTDDDVIEFGSDARRFVLVHSFPRTQHGSASDATTGPARFSGTRSGPVEWEDVTRQHPGVNRKKGRFRLTLRQARGENEPNNLGGNAMRLFRRRALASLAAATLLAAPIAARAETIRVGLPTKTFWPTTVAETAVRQKLFEKEGLTAELTIYRSGAETFEGMAAGAADIILDPPSLVSAGRKKGVMSRIVASATMGNYGWQLMVPAKSSLEIKDLG